MKKIISFIISFFIVLGLCSCDVTKKIVFEDQTIVYDGEYHELKVTNLPEGAKVNYMLYDDRGGYLHIDPPFCDAGTYVFEASVWDESTDYGTYKATLKILPKEVVVKVDDILETDDKVSELKYTVEGLINDDELGEYVGFDEQDQIKCVWENKNYKVVVSGGKYKKEGTIIDSYSGQYAPSVNYIPASLTPVAYKNGRQLENRSISSISFILHSSYASFNEKSYFYIYIVSTSYNTKFEDCSIENGKKIMIDITNKLQFAKSGDLIVVDGLNITLSKDETLAFGDPSMNYSMGYYENNDTNLLVSNIFKDIRNSVHTLPLVIKGYYYK